LPVEAGESRGVIFDYRTVDVVKKRHSGAFGCMYIIKIRFSAFLSIEAVPAKKRRKNRVYHV